MWVCEWCGWTSPLPEGFCPQCGASMHYWEQNPSGNTNTEGEEESSPSANQQE